MRRHVCHRAFTIVELMVVIFIIGLLFAILLPSLSRARDQANRTRCLNNLRQIGYGIAVYVSEYREYPPPANMKPTNGNGGGLLPVWWGQPGSGLLALPKASGFERYNLACPQGWASGGDAGWYSSRGFSENGTAYMDYAYWAGRFAPVSNGAFNVLPESFKFRVAERGTKILATDVITDMNSYDTLVSLLGPGNHGSNHSGSAVNVQRTDGQAHRISETNKINGHGASILFSDYHVEWFGVERLTQQVYGLCYPPCDQW